MKKWIYRFLIELTNHQFSSKCIKKFAQSKISRPFISSYAKVYKINQHEMLQDLHTYSTLHELFTRKLKPNARKISVDHKAIISPVDGVIEDAGEITADKHIKVKGKIYSLQEMIGEEKKIDKYIGGQFIILYLSPKHYHRIHSPVTGKVARQYTLGEKSYPVNQFGLKYGKSPLAKNYRVITELIHENGSVLIVKVGAMFINSIVCTHLTEQWKKGDEIAYFSFGSTVVLLFEKGTFYLDEKIQIPTDIKVGEAIGYFDK